MPDVGNKKGVELTLMIFHHHHHHHHHHPSSIGLSQPVPIQNLTSQLMKLFGYLVGLLGWGISLTQGLYVHRTTQHRKMQTRIHAPSVI
jgi:hypothetical protein